MEKSQCFQYSEQHSHYLEDDIINVKVLHEDRMDLVFRAVAESTEEAILNSMICANTTIGRNNHVRYRLNEYIEELYFNK